MADWVNNLSAGVGLSRSPQTRPSDIARGRLGPVRLAPLPANTGSIDLLGVHYAHLKTSDGGD